MELERPHVVSHSMGCGVAMKLQLLHPDEVRSQTFIAPVSPYGYSGSKGIDGEPCYEDGAPGGAASVNPDFIRLIKEGYRDTEEQMAPRNVMRQFYFKPPFIPEREEELLSGLLSERVGEEHYPGNFVPSEHWPGAAPGDKGIVNAFSRLYFDASSIVDLEEKADILWVRGDADLIVSNNAMFDIAALGAMGAVPGWPGAEACPPQPMIDQTRAVLADYANNGGTFREEVIADAGHSPYIEKPEEFNGMFHDFLAQNE
jgi:pimeloyl-ACP methyl ester carboxylesterase